jgi:hypothetical protein
VFPQPPAAPAPVGAPINPLHDLPIPPGNAWDGESLVAPDGLTVYIAEPALTVNIWDAATYFWPEAMVLAVLAWFGWRMLTVFRRRPQRTGSDTGAPLFYCRRCNYQLPSPRADSAAHCPECGVDTARKPPVRGRTPRARLRPTMALVAAAAVVWGCAWVLSPVSRLMFSGLLEVESGSVAAWLQAHPGVQVPTFVLRSKTAVHQIDVATGMSRHTFYVAGNLYIHPFTMAPGGMFIAFQGADGNNGSLITLIDTTAQSRRTFAHLSQVYRPAGLSSDGKRFYYADLYSPKQLMQLDTSTGAVSIVRKWPAFDPAFSMPWACVIDRDGKVTEAYFGELGFSSGVPDWPVAYHLISADGEHAGEFGEDDATAADSEIDADSGVLHIGPSCYAPQQTRDFNLRTGQVTPSKQTVGSWGPLEDTGSPVVFQVGPQGIDVLERATGKPVCALVTNPADLLIRAQLSRDGLFIVAQVQASAASGGSSFGSMGVKATSIRIWRLSTPFKPSP